MSKILNLKQYDIVFTTSFFYTHGVSGHLYELIDYYWVCHTAGIKSAILLADGVTRQVFKQAIADKYNFTDAELAVIMADTTECHQPKIIMTNNVCIVDGSWRVLGCTIYADNAFLLRCSEDDFTYFHDSKSIKRTHLMQDCKLYLERYTELDITVINYVKKILWGRYQTPKKVTTNTALLYLTTNCRAISIADVKNIIDKDICDNYLIVTNDVSVYKDLEKPNVTISLAPVKDIFEKFDTYIYTPTELQKDCSPRFIVECELYDKQVVYEIDYVCDGIERRKQDMANGIGTLELTTDDFFVAYVKEQIND